jgi:hypothetical protein
MEEADKFNENAFRQTKPFSVSLYPCILVFFLPFYLHLWNLRNLRFHLFCKTNPNFPYILFIPSKKLFAKRTQT